MSMNDLLSISGYSIGWAPDGKPQLVFGGAGDGTLADLLTAAAGADLGVPGIPTPDVQAAIAAKMARDGLLVQAGRPTQARRGPMAFESTGAIAAGGQAIIVQQPQVPFRPTRLIVPSDIAGSFVITDVRVGKNSQFPSIGGMAARAFQENAVDATVRWDTAQISQQIAIAVTNIGGAPATFRAVLWGDMIE